MKYFGYYFWLILMFNSVSAQIKLPDNFIGGHPRIRKTPDPKTLNLYRSNLVQYLEKCKSDPRWMSSRLQMYWKTRSTDVFIKGGIYDHAEGYAPVPTVKFPGARDHTTIYSNPKIEELEPYSDDPRGVLMYDRSRPGQAADYAEVAKTGRNIEAINTNIMRLAAEAGSLFRQTDQIEYGRFAFELFDTYMTGMYYRKEPYDLLHGHHQTIAGLSTFEVIQEVAMISSLTSIYDNLHGYIRQHAPDKDQIYVDTFKRWADVQLKNGVAFNNWNLMQAKNVLMIALVLEPDGSYPDKRGLQYYMNQVMNENSERQWSVVKIMNEGYDPQTGIWNESAGYASGVLHDFAGYVTWFDDNFDYDLLPQIPILEKAVLAEAEYIFPNGYTTGFGDSHYHQLDPRSALLLVANAKKHKKTNLEEKYSRFVHTIRAHNVKGEKSSNKVEPGLRASEDAGKIEDYVSPVFSAPNVSYFAQRNGMDARNGLMVAMAGSKGNHMHANGISMEIYGKGLILGPDGGIGTSYFQQDYAEYFSQFPAHNTVAVDGISAYPVMKSNHGFSVLSSYPRSGIKTDYFSKVTFGNLYFLEPETQSDQNRLTSIIRTTDSTGYYVDIFRSKRKDGKDKMHDYFYHNIGGELILSDTSGQPLQPQPTQKLSFAGGHLFAYDYFWDKKAITTDQDFYATFKTNVPGREPVAMNLWMKGSANREIFAVKAPASKSFRNNLMLPDSIAKLPLSTIVVRQSWQAWENSFVAVYEPTFQKTGRSIRSIEAFSPAGASSDFVGLTVRSKTGVKDFIFSSVKGESVILKEMSVAATYAVISLTNQNEINYLFLGNGTCIGTGQFSIHSQIPASAALYTKDGKFFLSSDGPVKLTLPDFAPSKPSPSISFEQEGRKITIKGKRRLYSKTVEYDLPIISNRHIVINK